MKKTGLIVVAWLLLALSGAWALAEGTENVEDEWTVLIYLCGSDLESRYSYATENLQEICEAEYPESYLPLFDESYELGYSSDDMRELPKVNVLIETGGCKHWHTQSLDMDIDVNSLQRWRLRIRSIDDRTYETDEKPGYYELLETQPLQNMAAPQTLSDFIQWGTKTCPAKKYALVLWDHGGGAKSGLIIDELFDGDVMHLYELKQALQDGGAQLELLLLDACLMANLETAWAVKDSARWMVGSEEMVPGNGTAFREWLQELFAHPECDGQLLGRVICDMTQIKYANRDDAQSRAILTWSVVDLSKIERLGKSVERFLQFACDVYKKYPVLWTQFSMSFVVSEEYGNGHQNMRDIADVFYNPLSSRILDHKLRNEMLDALAEAVVYTVRGSGRSAARGLSFCYPVDFSPQELDLYAKNCPSPHYLAFLDAITEWTAPDWVYKQVERLPKIDTIEALKPYLVLYAGPDGMPEFKAKYELSNLNNVYYKLYQVDNATGQTVLLGRTPCMVEYGDSENREIVFKVNDPMHWPSIDGNPCTMDLVMTVFKGEYMVIEYLYNIPVQINGETSYLRCGNTVTLNNKDLSIRSKTYQVFGLWEGYDENTMMTNRCVKSLAQLAGQDFRLLYPVDPVGKDGHGRYQVSNEMTMYRSLDVEEKALPAGTYYLEFEIEDMFLRCTPLERIEMHWDGVKLTFPNGF